MVKQLNPPIQKLNYLSRTACFFSCLLILLTCGQAFANHRFSKGIAINNKVAKTDSVQKDPISSEAITEIKFQAVSVIQIYESLLNSISFSDNSQSEVAAYVKNSYTPNERNRIFYSNSIIIEDDINSKFFLGNNQDLQADKYLNEFDLNYVKTSDFSIKFTNIKCSDVKKTDHIYVRVKFESTFGSKYRVDGSVYPSREREALVRVEPNGKKKWSAFIEGVSYYDPEIPLDNKDNNMQIGIDENTNGEEDYRPNFTLAKNKIAPAKKPVVTTVAATSTTSATDATHKRTDAKAEKHVEFPDFSIVFNKNLKAPDVKDVNPVFYIRISFDSNFGNKAIGSAPIEGEALVRMERNGKAEWNAFIENISYKKPAVTQMSDGEDLEMPVSNDVAMASGLDKTFKMANTAMLPTNKAESTKSK